MDIPQILLLCTLRQEHSQSHHLQTPENPAGFEAVSLDDENIAAITFR